MPPAEPRIARLGMGDLEAYKRLRDEVLARHEDAFTSDAVTERLRPAVSYAGRIDAAGAGFTLGAWQGRELVGAVTCEVDHRAKVRHIGHLVGMMVSAPSQGRGIGRALLLAAIEAARPTLAQLTLSVTASNAAAVHLYQTAGFVRYGTLAGAIRLNGQDYAKDLMVLRLS